jgi:NAD(P)-dependent dehydrogenase (short-subunit alcohol dehydrogenase family)
MKGRLEGKIAIITGGASGMGLATVERFVAEGARVVFCDLPPESDRALAERLGPLKAKLHHRGRKRGGPDDGFAIAERLGENALFVPADVSDAAQVAAVVDAAIRRFGGLDVMFNNAGIAAAEGPIADCPEEVFDRILAVNLKSVWLGIKFAAPHLVARGGGSIISTSSVAALGGISGLSCYTAAKAGIVGLTRTAAAELGRHRVRVNCICPGVIVTNISKPMFGDDFDLDDQRARINAAPIQPIPRAGESSDIANAALWLASDESTFVTGQTIAVDGGVASHSWLNQADDNRRQASGDGALKAQQ